MPGPELTRRHFVAGTGVAAGVVLGLAPGTAGAAATGPSGSPASPGSPGPAGASGPALAEFDLSDVTLLDSPFRANMRRTCAYLKAVDPDRLLHTFRTNVGLPSAAEPCGGWEAPDVQLRGHTTGHLLSGLAFAHANTGDDAYAAKARHLVAALAECQRAAPAAGFTDGYLSAFPEKVFADLEAGGKPWAPYYTIHKIMAGLLDQYRLSGNAQALDVLTGMAGWVEARMAPLDATQVRNVLRVEWGGMNEVLAALHLATGDATALRTARRFDQEDLFGPLADGRDELEGHHANTEIAKIVGAARLYDATGEERYRSIAAHFWDIVVHDHSYVIGGNSNQEFFGPPGEIVSRLSEDTCENCNTYNMLKLGRRLFLHDPDRAAYMDHHEWALYNQMLGEQDPDSAHGYVTYYTGLWAGSQRQPKGGLGSAPGSYSSDYDNFSCDHGTGLETHTKFADTVYFRSTGTGRAAALYVNLFIPSEVHWRDTGVTLRQTGGGPDTDAPVRITVTRGAARFRLKVRVPGWLADADRPRPPRVTVNGRAVDTSDAAPRTYLTLDRHWSAGDTVELTFPRTPTWRPAPDNPHVRALTHGPLVLAGAYGTVTSPTIPTLDRDSVRQVTPGRSEFTAVQADGTEISLRPFHQIHHQHYNVYFATPPRPGRPRETARYLLAEGAGTAVADGTRGHPDGLLSGGAAWTTGRDGRTAAVALDGTGGHVALPPGLITGLTELTVSAWVRVDTQTNSARVFDLGYHKATYLFLAVRTGTGRPRAALKIAGMEGEDFVDANAPLPTGSWAHVALTVGDGSGVLYVDGVEAGRNDAFVSSPLLLGATARNYLGRSQNPSHPYLHGAVAGFRIHNRALPAADVAALARA
ncbi:beta-L-arabinofuranosidase domain-containing protein [Streptomyces longispororuber]|uniref:beta-L-arabinofuranosidase domain-containing protein n=1 Tax=Streptomyces longispororuber TaxID=68230 RepID=UPI00210A75DA|nr:beta-L-arabinofuranosidase domain-containing protein [Streptomyces longispororuber]MCQ4211805.1 glycoside hydrolase family 127 protein [Streptomyces longispororuber]